MNEPAKRCPEPLMKQNQSFNLASRTINQQPQHRRLWNLNQLKIQRTAKRLGFNIYFWTTYLGGWFQSAVLKIKRKKQPGETSKKQDGAKQDESEHFEEGQEAKSKEDPSVDDTLKGIGVEMPHFESWTM